MFNKMKFKINNREWKIIEASQEAIKNKQNIRRANEDENLKSIIHELAHCYIDNYITHCDKQYTEEDVADIVSNSYDIIHEIIEMYFKEKM